MAKRIGIALCDLDQGAEAIAQTIKKGDEVIVIGTMKLNNYTDKNGVAKSTNGNYCIRNRCGS
jgi:hypothetical protein